MWKWHLRWHGQETGPDNSNDIWIMKEITISHENQVLQILLYYYITHQLPLHRQAQKANSFTYKAKISEYNGILFSINIKKLLCMIITVLWNVITNLHFGWLEMSILDHALCHSGEANRWFATPQCDKFTQRVV